MAHTFSHQKRNGNRVYYAEGEQQLGSLKAERNALLADTDIYMVEDFPTTKKLEWKNYRQSLRDMNFSDLDNITWPTKPE